MKNGWRRTVVGALAAVLRGGDGGDGDGGDGRDDVPGRIPGDPGRVARRAGARLRRSGPRAVGRR